MLECEEGATFRKARMGLGISKADCSAEDNREFWTSGTE